MNPSWIPLSSLPRTYLQTNSESLKLNQPTLISSLLEHSNRTDIFLRLTSTGIYACKYGTAPEEYSVHGWHRLQEEINHFSASIQKLFVDGAWLVIVNGAATGLVLPSVVDYLERYHRGEPKGLLVREKDPGLLLAGLCLYDFTRLFRSGRILFAVGVDFAEISLQLCNEHHLETLSPEQIHCTFGYEITHIDRKREYESTLEKFQIHHRESRAHYLEKLQSANKIWSIPSRSIHRVWTQITDDRAAGAILRGLSEGFGELGLESRVLQFHDRLFTRYYRCAYDFISFQPDALLGVNHSSRYIAAFAGDAPIPRLIWYVDHPSNTVEIPFHPCDFPFAVSPAFFPEIKRRGGKPLGVVPVASRSSLTPPPANPSWKHDLGYVGSVVDSTPILNALDSDCRTWVEQIVRMQISYPLRSLSTLIIDFPCPAPSYQRLSECLLMNHSKAGFMNEQQLIEYFLYTEANTRRRIQFMTALRNYPNLGIYGPPAWERLLPDDTLRHCYKGGVSSSEQLADLYRTCKVNLSINSLQGFGFVISRVFEVPAAGGFLLAEWVPGLESFFDAETELFWFSTLREMRNAIDRALVDEEMRWTVISRAQSRIRKEHTYRSRAKTILELISSRRDTANSVGA